MKFCAAAVFTGGGFEKEKTMTSRDRKEGSGHFITSREPFNSKVLKGYSGNVKLKKQSLEAGNTVSFSA